MTTRLDLLKHAIHIQETYGEDTVACLFAKEVEDFLHTLQQNGHGSYKEPLVESKIPSFTHTCSSKLSLENPDTYTWKADDI